MIVKEITAADTYPLRRSTLRADTVSSEVTFDGDDEGIHLGAFDGAELVGISSWLPTGDRLVYQLRGMATAASRQGQGIGALVLAAGIAVVAERGATEIVANARVGALDFYLRHGFETVGDVYLDAETTGLPHQRIRLRLDGRSERR